MPDLQYTLALLVSPAPKHSCECVFAKVERIVYYILCANIVSLESVVREGGIVELLSVRSQKQRVHAGAELCFPMVLMVFWKLYDDLVVATNALGSECRKRWISLRTLCFPKVFQWSPFISATILRVRPTHWREATLIPSLGFV